MVKSRHPHAHSETVRRRHPRRGPGGVPVVRAASVRRREQVLRVLRRGGELLHALEHADRLGHLAAGGQLVGKADQDRHGLLAASMASIGEDVDRTGDRPVDVIVDDTPGVVIVSAFDNIRRETARLALTKLIQDGRIHPTRIEEVVAKVKEEMDENVRKAGEDAIFRAGVPPLHEDIAMVLGRLKFRTSFSQNVLDHSVEVAHLTGLMAAELGLNVAADSFFYAASTGAEAGLVIVSADDPAMHSSQNEQDNRFFAKFAKIPMLEPSDSQEAKEFVKHAFE